MSSKQENIAEGQLKEQKRKWKTGRNNCGRPPLMTGRSVTIQSYDVSTSGTTYNLVPKFWQLGPLWGHVTEIHVLRSMATCGSFCGVLQSHYRYQSFYNDFAKTQQFLLVFRKTVSVANHEFAGQHLWSSCNNLCHEVHKIGLVTWLICFVTVMTYNRNEPAPLQSYFEDYLYNSEQHQILGSPLYLSKEIMS